MLTKKDSGTTGQQEPACVNPPKFSELHARNAAVGGYRIRLSYLIESIDWGDSPETERPPMPGESFSVCYDYRRANSWCSGGYEHLYFFIGRRDASGNIHNYVRYFDSIPAMEAYLSKFSAKLDTGYAKEQIRLLEVKAARLRKDYGL